MHHDSPGPRAAQVLLLATEIAVALARNLTHREIRLPKYVPECISCESFIKFRTSNTVSFAATWGRGAISWLSTSWFWSYGDSAMA
jgi:hypothetical protein